MSIRKTQRATQDALRLAAIGNGFLLAAIQFGEMLNAAQRVIGHRTELLHEAGRDPLRGDHAEFTRMVSEKAEASLFGMQAVTNGWYAIGRELTTYCQKQSQAAAASVVELSRCRDPAAAMRVQAAFAEQTFQRSTRSAIRLAGITTKMLGATLAPFHGRATRNAERLARAAARR
jgi:Phasin protein